MDHIQPWGLFRKIRAYALPERQPKYYRGIWRISVIGSIEGSPCLLSLMSNLPGLLSCHAHHLDIPQKMSFFQSALDIFSCFFSSGFFSPPHYSLQVLPYNLSIGIYFLKVINQPLISVEWEFSAVDGRPMMTTSFMSISGRVMPSLSLECSW